MKEGTIGGLVGLLLPDLYKNLVQRKEISQQRTWTVDMHVSHLRGA